MDLQHHRFLRATCSLVATIVLSAAACQDNNSIEVEEEPPDPALFDEAFDALVVACEAYHTAWDDCDRASLEGTCKYSGDDGAADRRRRMSDYDRGASEELAKIECIEATYRAGTACVEQLCPRNVSLNSCDTTLRVDSNDCQNGARADSCCLLRRSCNACGCADIAMQAAIGSDERLCDEFGIDQCPSLDWSGALESCRTSN